MRERGVGQREQETEGEGDVCLCMLSRGIGQLEKDAVFRVLILTIACFVRTLYKYTTDYQQARTNRQKSM